MVVHSVGVKSVFRYPLGWTISVDTLKSNWNLFSWPISKVLCNVLTYLGTQKTYAHGEMLIPQERPHHHHNYHDLQSVIYFCASVKMGLCE